MCLLLALCNILLGLQNASKNLQRSEIETLTGFTQIFDQSIYILLLSFYSFPQSLHLLTFSFFQTKDGN